MALNKATRIIQTLLKSGKEYVCLMHIHKPVEEKEILEVMKQFSGKIKQLPPLRSAVKRQVREREIYYLEVLEINGQDVLFKVGCQAGTYIRRLCLHPNTEIISSHSSILAKDFFINPGTIYSMDNQKIKQKFPSETQKLNFNGKLVKIEMSSGVDFLITPEHKMLVSTDKGYLMKKASNLTITDYIVKSLIYHVPEKELIISDLLDDSYLVDQAEIKKLVKIAFIKKYGSIRAMNKKLNLDRKSFLQLSEISIPISHIKKSGIYESIKHKINRFKTEKGTKIKLTKLNTDIMYLIGLIASDGNNTKEKNTIRHTRIKFYNKNKELIIQFKNKYEKYFPNFNLSMTTRDDGFTILESSNSFLASICASLGVKSPYTKSDLKPILYLNKKLICSFLKGYFDGDGSVRHKNKSTSKKGYSRIDFFTNNKTNAKRLHQLLLKLEISNKIYKMKNESYTIVINNFSSKKKFISKIGSNHPLKNKNIKLIKNRISHMEDQTYIGLHYKKYLKENKKQLKSLGGNLHRILSSNSPVTKSLYNKSRMISKLPREDEFCIEKIKKISKIAYSGNVYDMTVPKTHNFLIETGFVSSNCDDVGKQLKTGAHMTQLIRTKVGHFTSDDWHSLLELKDIYEEFKETNKEYKLRKIVIPFEKVIKDFPKIYVLDSTINSLTHGANLNIPGISKLDNFDKDSLIAILSLKGELVAIGIAAMPSKQIFKQKKGLAVKSWKVFMERDVYPKLS